MRYFLTCSDMPTTRFALFSRNFLALPYGIVTSAAISRGKNVRASCRNDRRVSSEAAAAQQSGSGKRPDRPSHVIYLQFMYPSQIS